MSDPMYPGAEEPGFGDQPALPFGEPAEDTRPIIRRERPEPDAGRAARVQRWLDDIAYQKAKHKPAFDRMREDMAFVFGKQWPELREDPETRKQSLAWVFGDRYVMNICQRHVAQRVAALYARNPKPAVKPKERIMGAVWDGTPQHAMQAAQRLAMQMQQQAVAQQAAQQGVLMQPPPVDVEAQQIVAEYEAALQHRQQVTRFARTMELTLQHYLGEQAVPFKRQMKSAVRRSVSCGVAYIKVGFQRQMQLRPDVEAQVNDLTNRLAELERLSAEIADGEADQTSAEADALRTAMESLRQQGEIVASEGVTFDFPRATAIIPGPGCLALPGFIGAPWVAEEYTLSADRIMQVYGVDPRAGANTYRGVEDYGAGAPPRLRDPQSFVRKEEDLGDRAIYRVYEVYCQADGTVLHLLEGYPDYLREPAPPPHLNERFWPWYALTFNEVENDEELFPPSDVRLMRSQQIEINRAREGLKEHRRANRPKMAAPSDALQEDDIEQLTEHPEDGVALVRLKALDEGRKVGDILQKIEMPGIDPNLYDVSPQMDDVLRVVGSQEANLGPAMSKSTATESAISESSRMSALSAAVDELDDTLGEVCRGAAQICLSELSEETVKEIVGPGALWPQMTREEIAREIFIHVEAGSTGRPNKAARVADFQSVAPFLIQTPGVRPDKLAQYQLTLLDTGMDMADFLDPALPSIAAMNAASRGMGGGEAGQQPSRDDPGKDPAAQGGAGGDNRPRERDPESGGVPNVPQAGGFGMARNFMPPSG